jgi:large subunit ribosomal protein L23
MSKAIALKPRLNEKTYGLAASRVYVFDVDRAVNKHSIARAVESQFEVKVTEVNTANIVGKSKRVISITGKRMKNSEGHRNDFKKAYVTLAEGNALPFFDAIDEEDQKEQATQEKFDKVAAKQAEKDEKAAAKSAKSEAKTTAKPVAKAAEKPADKAAKPVAKAEKPVAVEKPAVKPAETAEPEKHRRLSAWRGFRLRKRSKKNEDEK